MGRHCNRFLVETFAVSQSVAQQLQPPDDRAETSNERRLVLDDTVRVVVRRRSDIVRLE